MGFTVQGLVLKVYFLSKLRNSGGRMTDDLPRNYSMFILKKVPLKYVYNYIYIHIHIYVSFPAYVENYNFRWDLCTLEKLATFSLLL